METADIFSSGRLDIEVRREEVEVVRLRSLVVVEAEVRVSGRAALAEFVEVDVVGRARFRGITSSLMDSSLELIVVELGTLDAVAGEPSNDRHRRCLRGRMRRRETNLSSLLMPFELKVERVQRAVAAAKWKAGHHETLILPMAW
jgi:hypothetical protein